MIELFLSKIINELGATGLLIIGLYFLLYKPLLAGSESLKVINGELGEIIALLKIVIHTKGKNKKQ